MRNDVQGGSQTTGARDMAADGDDTVWAIRSRGMGASQSPERFGLAPSRM
jgi:hypothetical protein